MAAPILAIDTLETHQVAVDGALYPLRVAGQLSVLEHTRMARLSPRLDALIAKEPVLTDDEAVELSDLLRDVCALILGAPPEVQARLSDPQRLEVAMVFTALSRGMRPTRESQTGQSTPSTGATVPRDLRGSTRGPRRSRG